LSALRIGRLYPLANIPGTHFCYRLSQPQGHSAAGRIMSMKNSNDTIGNRTRDLPGCSSVPQPTAPPRATSLLATTLNWIGILSNVKDLQFKNTEILKRKNIHKRGMRALKCYNFVLIVHILSLCRSMKKYYFILKRTASKSGPGSSVGIATDYGLDGPGIESRWGRDFPPVQTGSGAHPASCKIGTESFPGVKCGRGVLLTTHPLLVPRSWKSRAITLPTLWVIPGL